MLYNKLTMNSLILHFVPAISLLLLLLLFNLIVYCFEDLLDAGNSLFDWTALVFPLLHWFLVSFLQSNV